jgi:hypothetical protein
MKNGYIIPVTITAMAAITVGAVTTFGTAIVVTGFLCCGMYSTIQQSNYKPSSYDEYKCMGCA